MAQNIGPLPPKYQDHKTTNQTERDTTNEKIKKEQHKTLHQLKQPYCMRCARDDHKEQQTRLYNKRGARACPDKLPPSEKTVENVLVKDFKPEDYKPPTHQFTKYGEHPQYIDQNINGIKTKVLTAMYHAYQCTERGFKIDILIPKEQEETIPVKDDKKEEKK